MTARPDAREAAGRPLGWLFPSRPAMAVVERGGEVRLIDAGRGLAFEADGAFGREILRALETGSPGPLLAALGPEHAVPRCVEQLAGAARVPLSAAAALAMGGFDTLFVELTARCNEACVHCYAGSGPMASAALDETTCMAVLEDAAALGFRRVQLTGGDPLLCEYLVSAVAQARALGIDTIEIFTNGLLLGPRLLDELAPLRPELALSLYGAGAAVHDEVTRTPGSHARTVSAIKAALARSFAVRVGVVAMPENAHEVEATVRLARSLGVEHVGVSASREVGRGRLTADRPEWHCDSHRGGDSSPRAGRGSLCVTAGGSVVPCIFNRTDVLGSVPAQRLADIAAQPALVREPSGPMDDLELCGDRLQCLSCRMTAMALRALGRSERRSPA